MKVERLGDSVFWFDVVARVCLRTIDHFQVLRFTYTWLRPEALQFLLKVVCTLDAPHEDSVGLIMVSSHLKSPISRELGVVFCAGYNLVNTRFGLKD